MKRLFAVLVCILVCAASCQTKSKTRVYNPAQVQFEAGYNPLFDGILYPSMMLALANYSGPTEEVLFSVNVTSPANNAVLRVVVDSTNLNYVTILQEVLPKKGERYTFSPSIKWKYDYLYRLRQQCAVDLTFTCYINDEEVDVKNLRLNCRSVNDCPLSIQDTSGRSHDFRWLFMGYVNEEHPILDSILSTMLTQGTVTAFTGYQKNRQSVINQVKAVWYYALNRGITYSSISCTANPSKRSTTQHIRFFDEVYNSRQANCIDACVFFASILRKIGLKPVILVEPCHAYLGYYADKNKKELCLLETTITSWINMPAMERSYQAEGKLTSDQHAKIAKYLSADKVQKWDKGEMTMEELKHLMADALFEQATNYRKESYEANKAHFTDNSLIGYQILPVEDLRKVVQPISAM